MSTRRLGGQEALTSGGDVEIWSAGVVRRAVAVVTLRSRALEPPMRVAGVVVGT